MPARDTSKYDNLDATKQLEQILWRDLEAAFTSRGCSVVHYGTPNACAPGGKPDIEIRDPAHGRLILVEVTRRKGSAADGEFIAVKDHLEKAISAGGYEDYCCLFVSPRTSARMSATIRDLYNRARERERKRGRVIAVDFVTMELLLKKLAESDPALYPTERLGPLFSSCQLATDDVRTRRLVAEVVLSEDAALIETLTEEMRTIDAEREQRLKKEIERLEDKLRDRGITGNAANTALVYLTFMRLYEEKRQREGHRENRFTLKSFDEWGEGLLKQTKTKYKGRLTEALLHEISEDEDLQTAGLLRDRQSNPERLHRKLNDKLIRSLVLPVFDEYEFYGSTLDVLGVVFETLARRAEKDTRIGQFFTPQEVVNFCAELVDLSPTDAVLDPAVGTARFLIAAMNRMLAKAKDSGEYDDKALKRIRTKQIIGVDIDEWVATIAKMNMYIHGDGKSNIAEANGLILADRGGLKSRPKGIGGEIDVVLTNPPLGDTSYVVAVDDWEEAAETEVDEEDRIEFLKTLGVVPLRQSEKTKTEKLAHQLSKKVESLSAQIEHLVGTKSGDNKVANKIEHLKARRAGMLGKLTEVNRAMKAEPPRFPRLTGQVLKGGALFLGAIRNYLKPTRNGNLGIEWRGGRAVVVVDEAILNTPDYGDVRKFIRQSYFVKAVISLGRSAFTYLAHTDSKTSLLYLIRKPNDSLKQREPILFFHAERAGYSRTGRWVGSDLPRALEIFRSFEPAVIASYRGASFDKTLCWQKLSALAGYKSEWHVRSPEDDEGGRLSFYYARMLDLVETLEASGMAIKRLGDLIEPRTPKSPPLSLSHEYDFATVERTAGAVFEKGTQRVSYKASDLWVVEENDIVVSGIDLIHGAVAVAGSDVAGLVMSKEMFPYRVQDDADVLPEYVALLLRTPQARDIIYGLVTGTSNRTRVTDPSEILSIPLPAPPSKGEQMKAVAVARDALRLRRQAQEKLEEAASLVAVTWQSPEGQ